MQAPIFHLALCAELAWAGFAALRWQLGLGHAAGNTGGWRALAWLAGALAIMLLATLAALRRQRRQG